MSAALQLYFIRHGETAWSITGQHTGHTELPLTPRGEDMARDLAPCLRELPFTRVFCSPRLRARRTCELAGLGTACAELADLAEWDYGDDEGRRSAETRALRPGWDIWRDGCPNGESPQQVSDRADRLLASLAGFDGRVALFSHGQFGRVLAARWIGQPAAMGRHWVLGPASLSILGREAHHPADRAVLLWNAAPGARWGVPWTD